ncbi:sensor domain-containing diguanylate cyclase [Paraferrimonas sp. SM1919]|uniref:sensor domain-containing diguanylate cyclase n=1 Tax=Paraferrimonas sp. SM1919 TaxID=2662263 RepID=UPI0013D6D12A|nr:sensor domain-containing diguanylate cyclase [Paraferrimonas sp. SM1919]
MLVESNRCIYQSVTNQIDFNKWQDLANLISEVFGSACGAIVQYRQDEFSVVVASENDDNFLAKHDSWSWHQPSFCRHIIEQGSPLYVPNPKADAYFSQFPAVVKGAVRSYSGVPVFWPDGTPFGTVCAIDTEQSDYSDTLQRLLEQLGRLVQADIKIMCDLFEISQLAVTDATTNTFNRRGFVELGNKLLNDAKRTGVDIGMLYLDINKLKYVNDNAGHDAGDLCICGLANILLAQCRANDIVARLGGDEFAVLVKIEQDDDLVTLAKRIKSEYRQFADGDARLSASGVSIGHSVAKYNQDINLEKLLKNGDKAMYIEKQQPH